MFTCIGVPEKVKRVYQIPEPGVTGGCELPHVLGTDVRSSVGVASALNS